MYNSYGTAMDWAKESGIKWTFLLELPPSHREAKAPYGFLLPPNNIIPVAHSVFEGFRTVALDIYNSVLFS
jgi:hypothetical protein